MIHLEKIITVGKRLYFMVLPTPHIKLCFLLAYSYLGHEALLVLSLCCVCIIDHSSFHISLEVLLKLFTCNNKVDKIFIAVSILKIL